MSRVTKLNASYELKQLRKRNSSCGLVLHKTSHQGTERRSHAEMSKKVYQKFCCTCKIKIVVLLIEHNAFFKLSFQLSTEMFTVFYLKIAREHYGCTGNKDISKKISLKYCILQANITLARTTTLNNNQHKMSHFSKLSFEKTSF